ncbi:MAG: glycosyltransferase, partial [Xanthobacteraceae bacterium]
AIRIAAKAGMKLKMAAKVEKADQAYFEQHIEPLLSQHHVEFLGEIGEDQKAEFLGNAAGMLFPIAWREPFGLVMIEAMACGTPVIAFNRGSVPEIIEDGLTGYIVEDELSAVGAIGQLSALSRERVRARFDERFTARRMANEYLGVYRQLAATPRLRLASV